MRRTLSSQLHFVQDIQKVDTEGVEPLRSISDVTSDALREREVTLTDLKEAFEDEEVVEFRDRTRWKKRDVREVVDVVQEGVESWDVLRLASRTEGRYYVVDGREQIVDTEEVHSPEPLPK
jgi:hypothetical protein